MNISVGSRLAHVHDAGCSQPRRTPRVLVVVLNWNGARNTLACIRHLQMQTFETAEVLVIDNGSTDDSVAKIQECAPSHYRIISLPRNLGFAEGMNLGIREAIRRGYDYIWMLNNDAFPEPDCLARLVEFMDASPVVGVTTPRLLRPNGSEQHAGGRFDWFSGDNELLETAKLTRFATMGTWLTGTALLVRVAALRRIGFFDSRFFAYWEDVDLCTRMLADGNDLRSVPGAVVHHIGSASTGGTPSAMYQFLMARNNGLFLKKHASWRMLPGAFLRFIAGSLERAGVLNLQGHTVAAAAIVAALAAVLRGRYGEPPATAHPRLVTHMIVNHPWRAARMMQQLAGWADRSFGVRSRFGRMISQ